MILEVTGDLLLSTADAIAHGVAPNDPFHNGLALALRERWPTMYKDFRHYCQSSHPKPGTLWEWSGVGESAGKPARIVALLTQEGGYEHGGKPGPANAKNINHALKDLHAWAEREKIQSLALPKLCTGVGGMSWESVAPLIHQHLGSLKIPISLYSTYHKGMQATEGK
jgi:O-acetyl-ADP-ribose deacetylase (regulator of RNase III)